MNGRDFAIDNYLSVLKEEIGANMTFDERIPGVYYIESIREDGFPQEYYAVLDTAPIAQKLRDHGKKIEGISLFAWDEPASGWRIIPRRGPSRHGAPSGIFRHVPGPLPHAPRLHTALPDAGQRYLLAGNQ